MARDLSKATDGGTVTTDQARERERARKRRNERTGAGKSVLKAFAMDALNIAIAVAMLVAIYWLLGRAATSTLSFALLTRIARLALRFAPSLRSVSAVLTPEDFASLVLRALVRVAHEDVAGRRPPGRPLSFPRDFASLVSRPSQTDGLLIPTRPGAGVRNALGCGSD